MTFGSNVCWNQPWSTPFIVAACTRPNQGDTKVEASLSPIGDELIGKDSNFPLTLIYGNLSRIAECFVHFSNILGPLQHEPKGAVPVAKNRMFSQLHAQCSDHERESTVLELVEGKSKLWLFFVTVAFGLYVDVSNIRRVIHIGVPYTLELYIQGAGRCDRDGPARKCNHLLKFVWQLYCKKEICLGQWEQHKLWRYKGELNNIVCSM